MSCLLLSRNDYEDAHRFPSAVALSSSAEVTNHRVPGFLTSSTCASAYHTDMGHIWLCMHYACHMLLVSREARDKLTRRSQTTFVQTCLTCSHSQRPGPTPSQALLLWLFPAFEFADIYRVLSCGVHTPKSDSPLPRAE